MAQLSRVLTFENDKNLTKPRSVFKKVTAQSGSKKNLQIEGI